MNTVTALLIDGEKVYQIKYHLKSLTKDNLRIDIFDT